MGNSVLTLSDVLQEAHATTFGANFHNMSASLSAKSEDFAEEKLQLGAFQFVSLKLPSFVHIHSVFGIQFVNDCEIA